MDTNQMVFNHSVALEQMDGDAEMLTELASLFLDDCPELLMEVKRAYEERDPAGLSQAAHSLKGSVSNFGARRAYNAAFRVEQSARVSNWDDCGAACRQLESEIELLCPLLKRIAG